MRRWIRWSGPVFAVCTIATLSAPFSGRALADEPKPASGVSAEQPAEVKKDLSTPKAAVKTFVQALANGNVEMAKAAAITDEQQANMLELMTTMTGSMKKLTDAAVAKFGEAGETISGQKMKMGENLKQIDESEVKIEGDVATIMPKDQKQPVKLKKQDGQWKVDMASMPNVERLAEAKPMITAMVNAANATATEINADKYKNVEEARTAFRAKMMAAVMATMPQRPATQPAPEGGAGAPGNGAGNGGNDMGNGAGQ
jgi:hypothetical protein